MNEPMKYNEYFIKYLGSLQAYYDELVSLYIPPNTSESIIRETLDNELIAMFSVPGTISKTVIIRYRELITTIIRIFQSMDMNSYKNGIAIFIGYLPVNGPLTEKEQRFIIVPLHPVPLILKRSSKFYVEPLIQSLLRDG